MSCVRAVVINACVSIPFPLLCAVHRGQLSLAIPEGTSASRRNLMSLVPHTPAMSTTRPPAPVPQPQPTGAGTANDPVECTSLRYSTGWAWTLSARVFALGVFP